MKREMSVDGSFYPAQKSELERYFNHFNNLCEENYVKTEFKSRAVIVPHAGYIYSGYTANLAYRVLANSGIKKFVVIGPSHKIAFDGVSLCRFKNYATPFGDIPAIEDMTQKLKERFTLACISDAHYEHSTEVQFAFLKHYIPDTHIVELVYSQVDTQDLSMIIEYILDQEDCGVIISSDLSHFYSLEDANKLDKICLESIQNLDIQKLDSGCEACGILGIKAMIQTAKRLSLTPHLLDYRTSADASEDSSRVVGYLSSCFTI